MSTRRPGFPTCWPASQTTQPVVWTSSCPGTGSRLVNHRWRPELSVRPREQGPEESLGLAQSLVGQKHRLGATDQIGDQPLGVKTAECLPVKAFPGPTLVVERQPQQGEHRLID